MDYFKILGENIRTLRIEKGLTQEQLAELSDLHRTYIGAIERGERNISLKNIVAISSALNVEPSILLQYDSSIESFLEGE